MRPGQLVRLTALSLLLTSAGAAAAVAQTTGIRHVPASADRVIPLEARLRYTTMIVLPDGEDILDVICGDSDFWVISATQNIAHVKPAKSGASTNLNLVTASGTVYSFLLNEKGGTGLPDLKVYVTNDDLAGSTPKYVSATQVEGLRSELAETRSALASAQQQAAEEIASYREEYPAHLRFTYGTLKYERPFLVRAIWHDEKFTYIKSDATELPALYEMKDGEPALVNFDVQDGTYVVPKVLDRGYLALGKQRLAFEQQER